MQVFLYWLGTQAYFLGIRLAVLWNPKARLAISGRKNLLKKIGESLKAEQQPRIWMHCASLGEFEQGRPVLERLRAEYPDYALVLTFFSPSGYEVRKNYEGADYVFYLPFDAPAASSQFVHLIHPQLAIFVKYEYWYFLLNALKRQQVPIILIAALFHKEQPFFKWYGGLHRKMLGIFSHLFVQDQSSKELLQTIRISQTSVAGDPRFDRVLQIAAHKTDLPIASAFCSGSNQVLVAGSTWREDEQMLEEAWEHLSKSWKLILVPHEVDKAHIEQLVNQFGNRAGLWSDKEAAADKEILIVDRIGLLSQLYRYGRVAYIGGGFGKEGIHNVLEAAVYGIPCLHGPVYNRYLEARELVEADGSHVVQSPSDTITQLQNWQTDGDAYDKAAQASAQYVHSKTGATNIIMDYLRAKKSFNSL